MTRAVKAGPAGEHRRRNVFGRLFRPRRQAYGNPAALYGAIVAQARDPFLYAAIGVPDTIEGRFEMVLLHTILVVRRLGAAGADGIAIGQEVFDLFCRDMDRSLREMGVGDLAVPKRMRKLGEAYYGRAAAYEEALQSGDASGLAAAFGRNVWPDAAAAGAAALARYAIATVRCLDEADPDGLAAGAPAFPQPRDFAEAEVAG
jgi:cytochrome b pre-mRNA-processing protein 3